MAAIAEPFDTIVGPLPTPLGADTPSPQFDVVFFETIAGTPAATSYFLMEAYDSAALLWKTWVATGAPDPTASQYPGPPFPFTIVSCLRTWSA